MPRHKTINANPLLPAALIPVAAMSICGSFANRRVYAAGRHPAARGGQRPRRVHTWRICSTSRLVATNSRRVGMSTPYTLGKRTGGLALHRYTYAHIGRTLITSGSVSYRCGAAATGEHAGNTGRDCNMITARGNVFLCRGPYLLYIEARPGSKDMPAPARCPVLRQMTRPSRVASSAFCHCSVSERHLMRCREQIVLRS